ncbi:Os09g0474501, partial [Oryza sativa Japonica Group]
ALTITDYLALLVVTLLVDLRGPSLITKLIIRLSLSSFPVIVDALTKLDLLNSELGFFSLNTSLITDVTSWFLHAYFIAAFLITEAKVLTSFATFVLSVAFVAQPAGRRPQHIAQAHPGITREARTTATLASASRRFRLSTAVPDEPPKSSGLGSLCELWWLGFEEGGSGGGGMGEDGRCEAGDQERGTR